MTEEKLKKQIERKRNVLRKINEEVAKCKKEALHYQALFNEDGYISLKEKKQLNKIFTGITTIESKQARKEQKIKELEKKIVTKKGNVEEANSDTLKEATAEDYKNLTASTENKMYFSEEELPIEPIDFTNKITDSKFLEATLDYNLKLIIESLNPFSIESEITKEIKDDDSEIILPYKGNCNLTLVFDWKYTENTSGRKDVMDSFKHFQKGIYKATFQCLGEDYRVDDVSPKETERLDEKYLYDPFYHIKEINSGVNDTELFLGFSFGRSPREKTITMGSLKDFSFSKNFKIKILPFPSKNVEKTTVFIKKEVLFEKENQRDISDLQFVELEKWYFSLSDDIRKQIEDKTLKIIVNGYTTHTGTEKHNSDLGDYRATTVSNILERFIGKGLANITERSIGEREKSKRYAEIIIESN